MQIEWWKFERKFTLHLNSSILVYWHGRRKNISGCRSDCCSCSCICFLGTFRFVIVKKNYEILILIFLFAIVFKWICAFFLNVKVHHDWDRGVDKLQVYTILDEHVFSIHYYKHWLRVLNLLPGCNCTVLQIKKV